MDGKAGISMDDVAKLALHIQRDGELLPAFADEGFGFCFSCFQLAAGEFPAEGAVFARRALADQKILPVPNECSHNLQHCPCPRFNDMLLL